MLLLLTNLCTWSGLIPSWLGIHMDRRGRELAFTSNAGKIHAVAQDLRPLENVQISVFLTNIMHSFVYLRRERGLVGELCQHNIMVFIEGISGGFYLHIMYTHHRQGMWINRGGTRRQLYLVFWPGFRCRGDLYLVSSGAYTLHLSIFEKWEQKKNFFIRNLLIS